MSTDDPQFEQALKVWLSQHANDPAGIYFVEFAGHHCVVKRQHTHRFAACRRAWQVLRVSALAWLCWLLLGERPSTQVLLQNSLVDEARRLIRLKSSGLRVPTVWHQTQQLLVLEFVGQDMPYLIRLANPEARLSLMNNAAQELARFHQAGFVHGGAQLRNLMMQDGVFTRIDFEENIAEALSLPLGQAYDVFQMLSSMAGLRGHEFDVNERQALCEQLLMSYLKANPDPLLRKQLQNFERKTSFIENYLGAVLRRVPGRDIQGFLCVSKCLRLLSKR